MRDLAGRAVACPGWRWMPGMLMITGRRWRRPGRGGRNDTAADNPGRWPDLEDPATLGCVLYLLRRAWGTDDVCLAPYRTRPQSLPIDDGTKWDVMSWHVRVGERECPEAQTQGGAVVLALEEAPCESSE